MATFGFEAEFQQGAPELAHELYNRELVGSPELHGYHCDCEYCDYSESRYPFRVQRDSSCSGEVISSIFDTRQPTAFRYAMAQLQDAAIEVDAEPGPNSGFHVHVGFRNSSETERGKVVLAFMSWEPFIEYLAGGRWTYRRAGMNNTVRQCSEQFILFSDYTEGAPFHVSRSNYYRGDGGQPDYGWLNENLDSDMLDSLCLDLWYGHSDMDRHSNLNLSTRHRTIEFRVWNSTRSAWRMELFCGVSVAFRKAAFINALLQQPMPGYFTDPAVGEVFASTLDAHGFGYAAELVQRQLSYLTTRAPSAPAALTSV